MASILEIGGEHISSVLDGDAESLRSLFATRLAVWGKPYAHEEFVTVGLFDDVEQNIESHVAFSLIESAADIALNQQNGSALVCAITLLQSLVAATHTTEVPVALKSSYPKLVASAKALGSIEATNQLASLAGHYRHAL